MARVILLHWNCEEAEVLARHLRGLHVDVYAPVSGEGMKGLAGYLIPDALVVSLDRMPSHGHAVAWHYHSRKASRHVPIVFVGGEAEKVAKIRASMPNALYCSWRTAAKTVLSAIANPPAAPAKAPKAMMSNRPMHAKLELKPGMRIALVNAPEALERLVPDLDFEVEVTEQPDSRTDATLWFVRSPEDVDAGLSWIAPRMGVKPRIWVFYRKGQKGVTWQGLSETAAQYGLAQFRVLSLNSEWTGVAFGQARTKANASA